MPEAVDETGANWVLDIFGNWFDPHVVSHERYLVHLERIVWLAAMHGRVVFMGRGTQFVLPRDHGLAVRIVAPLDHRVARVVEECRMSDEEARRWIESVDAGRRDFVHRRFQRDLEVPTECDLVINRERFGVDEAAEMIVDAYRTLNPDDVVRRLVAR
ncbi:MAG: AAA family ATPase [Pirellulales bacterium]